MSNQRRQFRLGKQGYTGLGGNQSNQNGGLLFISITPMTYSFNEISTYIISKHYLTDLGVSNNLIGLLSRTSN